MRKEILDFPFIRYPRAFISNPVFSDISIEARTLFAIFLDRFELSNLNSERFTDDNGEVFVVFTLREVCEKLGCSNTRAIRIFKELENKGLIKRKRENRTVPYRIYITDLFCEFTNCKSATLQNDNPRVNEIKPRDFTECKDIYNNINYTDYSYIQSSIMESEQTEEMIREQIEYDCIVHDGNRKMVDEMVMIISDVFTGITPTVRVGRDNLPRGAVISRLRKLDSEHILFIISEIEHNTSKIRNIKSFILTSLYNAPATMEITVAAEFAKHNNSVCS